MEKRTLLAVVLSVAVISAGYLVQSWLFPPVANNQSTTLNSSSANQSEVAKQENTQTRQSRNFSYSELDDSNDVVEQRIVISTNLVKVVFSNRGGDIISYKLLQHKDKNDFVEMVLPGEKESHAFTIAFGDQTASPLTDYFKVNRISDTIIEFSNSYNLSDDKNINNIPVKLIKRYEFKQDEYLFELSVTLDAGYTTIPISFNGIAYSLGTAPQIGPKFAKLSQNYEYRRFYTYLNGKSKTEKVNPQSITMIGSQVSWSAIAGKYFALIAIPETSAYQIAFSSKSENGIAESSKMYFLRSAMENSKITDNYKFYLGPKTQKELSIYNDSNKNGYKLRDMNISAVVDTSGILAPLEFIMKWCLMIFYKIIPNYGIAIILLTILVKVLMFPLTKKSSESTLKMQALSPKIKDIQTKYKENPNKMNVEMAELYKKEGYNPMSGCLPMILQIPIFFAMYNLFNNHFDLRGAMFIPGWIPDLSVPETIWNFSPFSIPFLGWTNLRLLPFMYLFSQLLYGKITQTPDQQNNSQMKMMLFAMPIMFFFILYDVPSGLLIYWILSNVLTLLQQIIINKFILHPIKQSQANYIAPNKQKK